MVAEGGEGENPLPFSLTAPKRGGGWGGGGGVGGVSRLRFPAGPHLRSSRFSRHPRLRQAPTRRFAKNERFGWFLWGKGPRPLVGRAPSPGARAPSPLETWPTGPWGLDPAEFLWAAPSPFWRPGQQARALHPGSLAASRIPKMPRCSSAHEKPGLLHRLISCAVPAA